MNRHLALLTLLAYLLFFHHLGVRDLWSSHEARAAQNAAGMLQGGHWLIPRLFDGRVELQKPPLYYWLVAALSGAKGEVTADTVRLPAAIGATITLFTIYLTFAAMGRANTGLVAALMLATFVRFTWLARVGRIDMPLTAAVTMVLCAVLLASRSSGGRRVGLLLVACLAAAAAVLLKGPIGLVLPGLVVIGWTMTPVTRPLSAPAWRALPWGLLVVGGLVLPWYLVANSQTEGRFFEEFFWKHNWRRGLGGDEQLDGHVHPFWFYAVQLVLDGLPWSVLIPLAAIQACPRVKSKVPASAEPVAVAGWLWFIALFLFLSMVRYKRPDYLLPAYPGLAIGLACWLETSWPKARLGVLGVAVSMAAGWLIYVDCYLPRIEPRRELKTFATAVRARAGNTPILLFRAEVHQLTWHLRHPVQRLWEWENLDIWAAGDQPLYIITRPEWAAVWRQHLEAGSLRQVLTWGAHGSHEEEFVLLVTEPTAAASPIPLQ